MAGNTKHYSAPFRKMERNFRKAVIDSLEQGANKGIQEFDKNIRNKSFFGGTKWKPNTTRTPILVKSGRLRQSIRTLQRGRNHRQVGTTIEYGYIHNYGGTFPNKRTGGISKMPQRQYIGEHPRLNKSTLLILRRNLKKYLG